VKLSIAIAASLVGMVCSSVGVAWVVGPPANAATGDPAAPVTAPVPASAPASVAAPPTEAAVAAASFVSDGALRLEGRVGHAVLPSGESHETFVMLDVAAGQTEGVEARALAHVSIVLDRSGSMKGRRMTNAMAALRGMLAQLRKEDTVSIVTYADSASVLLPATAVRDIDVSLLSRRLDAMRSSGHTCISCGIDAARAQLRDRPGAVNRMLLLSDGLANRGLVDPTQFRRIGDEVRRERTAIASIGVDLDYDERTLFALSEASDGRHYFVSNPAGLSAVFEQERVALVGTIAADAEAEIALADGVELVEVVDRSHRMEAGRVKVPLGSFAVGDTRTVLLRVRVAGGTSSAQLADVRLSYRDLVARRDEISTGALGVRFEGSEAAPLDPNVDARLGRKDTFDALISANAAFARGDLATTRRQLKRARESVVGRKGASGGSSAKNGADFDRQIKAIDAASTGFEQALREAPPTVAPATSTKGKIITRDNAEAADPFSD
jgi:Ca-activated chloride channel family protein